MIEFLSNWLALTWDMVARSAFFLIIGFLLAGIVKAFVTQDTISKTFGKGRFTQIYKSSLIGIPLPLCSCSVLPVAAQLRKSGLSRAGTVSFLISTPETGIDSIALSYRLLGPVFAVARPLAALLTALVGGLAIRLLLPRANRSGVSSSGSIEPAINRSLVQRLKEGLLYIQKNMFPELSYYLFWGFLLAGFVAALIPDSQVAGDLPAIWQYLGVIVASLPVYVCATSSTPLAAVLISLGVLPGAVLTFLLVGPATNLTSLVVQKKILGLKGTLIMTASIVMAGILCGLLLDMMASEFTFARINLSDRHSEMIAWYDLVAGIVFAFFMVYYTLRHYLRKIKKLSENK